jgi:hypothetical protein
MANKYRLKDKVGSHIEGGRSYKAGDKITSNRDLAKMFPHKFEDLGPVPEAPVSAPVPPPKKSKKAIKEDWDDEKDTG